MRLIDADALESKLRTLIKRITPIEDSRDMFYHDSGINGAITGAILEVKKATTIDPASQRPKGEWISVGDRLPGPCKDVLLAFWREATEFKNMAVGFLVDVDEDMTMWCAYTDEGFYTDCDYAPTHWMPLPEPPDMRGEGDAR